MIKVSISEAFCYYQYMAVDPTKQAHDYMLVIGKLVIDFARVTRAPRLPDGARETDVEHSFHLGLSATELAGTYFPDLDAGLVAQFSLVHDLPEVYVGDVWTFGISPEDRAKKEQDEKQATLRLLKELPPNTANLLERYEKQIEKEALEYHTRAMATEKGIIELEKHLLNPNIK